MRSPARPLSVLEEQRAFCLNTLVYAMDRLLVLPKGSRERKRMSELTVRALAAHTEIKEIESKY